MFSIFILVLAIFLWLVGYFLTAHIMTKSGPPSSDLEKIVSPPKWLYYLCGAPSSKNFPKGTMMAGAFRAQIGGLALIAYFIWGEVMKPSMMESAIGFLISAIVPLIITGYVSKYYVAKGQNKRRQFTTKP